MNIKSKQVIVTGADGFIGSHLVEALVKRGARVKAFVYYNSFNRWGWLDTVAPDVLKDVDVFCGDVRDPNGVAEALQKTDVVFHLAALIGIPFSYHSPDSYVDTNIKGTLNILQAARRWDLSRVVHTSTSEVYGTAQYVPIDERHPVNPQSPYAATKSAADSLALTFYRSFGLPVTVLRPFNTFGPRQSARAVIPTIISQALAGHKEIQLGAQDVTRDFTYVTDTVEAFIRLAESDKAIGDVYNAGSGREVSVADLVSQVGRILKRKLSIKTDKSRLRPAKSEVERLLCNAERLTRVCGWQPTVSLEEGIVRTCAWLKNHLPEYKTGIYNI